MALGGHEQVADPTRRHAAPLLATTDRLVELGERARVLTARRPHPGPGQHQAEHRWDVGQRTLAEFLPSTRAASSVRPCASSDCSNPLTPRANPHRPSSSTATDGTGIGLRLPQPPAADMHLGAQAERVGEVEHRSVPAGGRDRTVEHLFRELETVTPAQPEHDAGERRGRGSVRGQRVHLARGALSEPRHLRGGRTGADAPEDQVPEHDRLPGRVAGELRRAARSAHRSVHSVAR